MAAAEQMYEAATDYAISHRGGYVLNVRNLRFPNPIQCFRDAITILSDAHNMPPEV
jgi:hypothetical protein